ncbi:YozE family protein [[Clostridium] colinum]|uniref:YozE family protein n=1 Tax=[Clostridium] colinum TaxID=36835 RepID=UPI0020243346|nr:YozE family protein [[Clostridium] colinum]
MTTNKDKYWNFKKWVSNFKDVTLLPIGDLARDIICDEEFPEDDYFIDILNYLQEKNVSDEIIKTFNLTWVYYLSSTNN